MSFFMVGFLLLVDDTMANGSVLWPEVLFRRTEMRASRYIVKYSIISGSE
jgi:hypothetical protein